MPTIGIEEWDRPGGPFHNPAGLDALVQEFGKIENPNVEYFEMPVHINDPAFSEMALTVFDRWVAEGKIDRG